MRKSKHLMEEQYTSDKLFENIDFKVTSIKKGVYENCRFKNCELSEVSLAEYQFIDCQFDSCNLSLVDLSMTTLNNISFKISKMIGLRFDTCNQFALSFSFDHCSLNNSSFYKTKIRKTVFTECNLSDTDFTECDLSEAVFNNCDFKGALFERTIVEKADLSTSFNFTIDPENNRIKKAIFSPGNIIGLLSRYDINLKS